MSSPAERFAAARARAQRESSPVGRFTATLDIDLDDFQEKAIQAVADGSGVLVAAPTGAGKTIVGEFAVALALETGRKAFYTTPIKALSNQKYHDLVAQHGAGQVGLLTGDSSVNGEAPVVVMTTEVLRNMMYAGSRTLGGLGFVVMDEVHYLADRFRGAVWEEVIIHLPDAVQVVSLSATVSNAEEFGDWLRTVRGNTQVIVSEHRPVPLWQHMLVGRDLYDVFVQEPGTVAGQTEGTTRVNPDLLQRISSTEGAAGWRREDAGGPRGRRGVASRPRGGLDPVEHRGAREAGGARAGSDAGSSRGSGRSNGGSRKGRGTGGSYGGPRGGPPAGITSRAEVIEELHKSGLLPAITFIFSRAGCDAAVTQLLMRGTRLVSDKAGRDIRRLVEERVADVGDGDLGVLGYHEFVEGLGRGYAAHHAGMLPLFREIVEELFTAGRIQAVFATETLALGINMPARTVVLEKLVKFNGEQHAPVTPAEYTQLTGRAGRRGIDIEGHAVVLHRRGVDPYDVAGLASTRTYPLRSSFRPSYNMAVNLVAQFGRDRAHELLQASFAQFQADRGVVGLTAQLRRNEEAMAGYAESSSCERGDFAAYARIRHRIGEVEKAGARQRSASRRSAIEVSLEQVGRGDVVHLSGGRRRGMAVVIAASKEGGHGPDPAVLTSEGQLRRLGAAELEGPLVPLATMRIPAGFNPRNVKARKDLAATLRATVPDDAYQLSSRQEGKKSRRGDGQGVDAEEVGSGEEMDRLRAEMRRHPCHACPDREDHARWSERWWRLRRDSDDLQRRVASRTHTVARTFDRICELLAELGYLNDGGLMVTTEGQRLRRLYTVHDLVAAECLRRGSWQRLDAASLAGVLSVLIHEPRGEETLQPKMPNVEVAEAYHEMVAIWSGLQEREVNHRLPSAGDLDAGIVWSVHRWASGRTLEEVLRDSDLSAGDFVRRCKQVIDLLGQVAHAADGPVASTARRATDAMLRGVVAVDRLD